MSGWPTSAPTARRSPPSTGKPHSPKPPEPETTTDAGRRWTGSCRDSRRSSPNGLWSTSALRTASCPTAASRCSVHRSTPSGSGSRCRWPTRSRRSTARRRSSASGNRAASPPEEEIEWEFLTGLSIDYSSIATEAYGNIPQAIPYVEQALAKLEKYPLEERVHFEKLCREELADIYLYADDPRAAGQIGRCIDLHRAWVAADKRFERPAATRRNT